MSTIACDGLHIAINSLATYDLPRGRLLRELAAAGVPMSQVHVFLGGSEASGDNAALRYTDTTSGAWFYRVMHNSVDVSKSSTYHIRDELPPFCSSHAHRITSHNVFSPCLTALRILVRHSSPQWSTSWRIRRTSRACGSGSTCMTPRRWALTFGATPPSGATPAYLRAPYR